MLVPTLPDARYLILDDADMPAALSVALATEQASLSDRSADRESRAPVVVPAWWRPEPDQAMPMVHRAVEHHAALYGVRTLSTEMVVEPGEGPAGRSVISRLLLAAADLAASEGCDAVLFPIRAAEIDGSSEPSLDTVACEVDRAALVSRLASLGGSPCSIVTPLVDLDDAQTADLSRDLAVPIDACWWAQPGGDPIAERYAERWRSIRGLAAVSAGTGAVTAKTA